MDAGRKQRGDALLLAHCASLDPAAASARERLGAVLGEDLALRLVAALCAGPPVRERAGLNARAVFAA